MPKVRVRITTYVEVSYKEEDESEIEEAVANLEITSIKDYRNVLSIDRSSIDSQAELA